MSEQPQRPQAYTLTELHELYEILEDANSHVPEGGLEPGLFEDAIKRCADW